MTAQQLLRSYKNGRLTSTGLILHVLSLTDKQAVGQVLQDSPPLLRKKLKTFAREYRPTLKVFNGPRPKMQTVRFVRNWSPNRLQAKLPS
jgi:hypothetical protein